MNIIVGKLKEKLEGAPKTKKLLELKKILEYLNFYVITKDDTGELNDFWPYSMTVIPSKKSVEKLRRGNSPYFLQISHSSKGYNVTPWVDGKDWPDFTYKNPKMFFGSDAFKTLKSHQDRES